MKGSSTCRICGRWMEAGYAEDHERVKRETRQGHCDGCELPVRVIDARVALAATDDHPGGTIAVWEHAMVMAAYAVGHQEPFPATITYAEFVDVLGCEPRTYLAPGAEPPVLNAISGRPQAEIDADIKAMRAEQAMQRQVAVEQESKGIGPLLFLDWESPLDPNWARRFGIQL